jgi:hypothetical protein
VFLAQVFFSRGMNREFGLCVLPHGMKRAFGMGTVLLGEEVCFRFECFPLRGKNHSLTFGCP